jgi:murein L,D-transpeptidase YcbB/YkuD
MPYWISISVRLALVLLAVLPASTRRDIWFQNGQPTRGAQSLIEAFTTGADAGLDPEDYHASNWTTPKIAIRRQNDDVLNEAFTADAQRYIGDLRFGRIPARTSEMRAEIDKIVSALTISADPQSLLNSLDPPFPAFRRSLKVLEQYRRLAQTDGGQKIPVPSRPVREGDEWSGFDGVRRRLRLLGDLPEAGQLTDAIRCFQSRHGLAMTGAVDRATVLAMNVPVAHRVRQIELTLE